MKYRNLRIAWSVAWGLLAVLLCVLWVRSYWKLDILEGMSFEGAGVSHYFRCASLRGGVELVFKPGLLSAIYASQWSQFASPASSAEGNYYPSLLNFRLSRTDAVLP